MVLFYPDIHPIMKNCCCYAHPLDIFEYRVHTVYLINMKALTYTLYKQHCELYTEIHGSIAVNSCQIELAQKDIILQPNVSIIVYKFDKCNGVENIKLIHFNLSAGTYSIDNFNAKIKVTILQKRQDWNHLKLKT